MVVDGFEPLEDGIALKIMPANPVEEKKLRQMRDRLAEHLQMKHPGHCTYSFHVSLAYMLRHLDQQNGNKLSNSLQGYRSKLPTYFELGAPEFCTFDNMFAFNRDFFLEKKG